MHLKVLGVALVFREAADDAAAEAMLRIAGRVLGSGLEGTDGRLRRAVKEFAPESEQGRAHAVRAEARARVRRARVWKRAGRVGPAHGVVDAAPRGAGLTTGERERERERERSIKTNKTKQNEQNKYKYMVVAGGIVAGGWWHGGWVLGT